MSGGSYDYAYQKIDDMANRLIYSNNTIRKAFGKHLKLVANAMHDIEWVDSCDSSPGDENESIKNVLGKQTNELVFIELKLQAENLINELKEFIKKEELK